jgi:HD superfamily phosphodiesterase
MTDTLLARASQKWENCILEYLSGLYSGQWLPSHDIGHHKRVWKNAVGFCKATNQNIWKDDEAFFEKLIICCYFHDVGLLVDNGEYHGKASREICGKFLAIYSEQITFDVEELLIAIENHDEKNYCSDLKNRNPLFEVLTLADDLDAFGAIGVYRYIEIYLLRGGQPKSIADRILINAQQRFENIKLILAKYSVPLEPYNDKFQILITILATNKGYDDPEILVNWINERIVKQKEKPIKVFGQASQNQKQSKRISGFLEKFIIEVQQLKD